METVEINGVNYRTGKLDAFQQFHAVRRLTPLLKALGQTLSSAPGGFIEAINNQAAQDEALADPNFTSKMWESFGPFADAIAEIPDQDAEYVLKLCMKVCARQNAGINGGASWTRVTDNNGNIMFDDIDMVVMLKLSYEVIKDNLSNFLLALQSQPGGEVITSGLRQLQ